MAFEIVFTDSARAQYKSLNAWWQASIKADVEIHLRHEPAKISKSRIKRLRELDHPQYRLRIGDYRVFYDIEENSVVILAIVPKEQTENWLLQYGIKSK